jgi:hypothetical protein
MGIVTLAEEQKVAEQRTLRRCGRGCVVMARLAEDHRRLKLGERVGVSSAGRGQGGAERQAACQGKTHQRQEKQAQHGTLDQG